MRERDVRVGGRYQVRISGRTAVVRVLREAFAAGARRRWVARTEDTRREITVTAARLRRAVEGTNDNS